MKKTNVIFGIVAGVLLLAGCASYHPPTVNPYYPGYHARNPETVKKEYKQWEDDQAVRAEKQRVQDSLWTAYSEDMKNRPLYYRQYNFYGDYDWYWNRYPYHRYNTWYHPYGYYPHYPRYGNTWYLGFSYSTQPWFVNTWWADDYLWDRYFWSYPYTTFYSDWYVRPPMFGYGYGGYYNPYWDLYGWNYYPYSSDSHGNNQPQGQRPQNRDQFFPGGIVGPSNPASGPTTIVSGPRGGNSVTPAVIDRSKYRDHRPSNRDNFFPQTTQTTTNNTSGKNGGKNSNNTTPSSVRKAGRSVSSSSGSSSSSSSKTVNRSGSSRRGSPALKGSSGSSGSSSKSSGNSGSSKKSERRPRNRLP